MKKETKITEEFSIEELETRLELTAKPWIQAEPCDNLEHCHPWNEQ